MITLLLTCLFLVCLYYYYMLYFSRKGRHINSIPGYVPLPIVGNSLSVCWYSPEELWLFTHYYMHIFYPISKILFFGMPFITTRHPNHIEKILSSTEHTVKGLAYTLFHPWLGEGLLTSSGMKWHKRRKILTPAFHFSILKQFVEVLIKEGNSAVESFNHTEESIIEDLQTFTSHHTLNAICETAMGISLKDFGSFQQQYRQTVHDMGKIIVNRFFKPWYLNEIIFNLSSLRRAQDKYLNILHSFTEKIITIRKYYHEQMGGQDLKHLENKTETEDTEMTGIKKKRMAMLDILIAESRTNGLTDLDIREEVDTFVFEGHDTVAISMCFSLLLLAEHKNIQDRVRKEICEVMQEYDGKLTMNALQNLSYLERCLKESMRLYPSVPFISRKSTEDVQLDPYLVPKDTNIFISIYDLHHDPNYWANPEVFDPDRFLPENIQEHHPYSYLPFSAGPRNCIGQRFAMLELKALIAPMVYNFYLESIDYLKDVKFKLDFVLRATHPIRMKVIPIKRT